MWYRVRWHRMQLVRSQAAWWFYVPTWGYYVQPFTDRLHTIYIPQKAGLSPREKNMSRAFAILLASLLLCNPLAVCAKSKGGNSGMAPGNAMSPAPSTNEEDDGSSKGKKRLPVPGLPLLGMGAVVGGAAGLGMLMRKGKHGKGGNAGATPPMGPTGVYNPAGSGATTLNTMGGGQSFGGVTPFLSTTNPASMAASQVPFPAPQAPSVITNYSSGGDTSWQTGNLNNFGGNTPTGSMMNGSCPTGGGSQNWPGSSTANCSGSNGQFPGGSSTGCPTGGGNPTFPSSGGGQSCQSGGNLGGYPGGGGNQGSYPGGSNYPGNSNYPGGSGSCSPGGNFGGGGQFGTGGQFGNGGSFGVGFNSGTQCAGGSGMIGGGGQFGTGGFGGNGGCAQGRSTGSSNGFKSNWWGQRGGQSGGCADGYREGWWGDHCDEPHAQLYPDSM